MSPSNRRIIYASLIALVALVAPLLLWWLVAPQTDERWLISLIIVPVVGPMIFGLLSRSRPRWGHGVAFAIVLAVIAGLYSGIVLRIEQSGPGAASFVGGLMFLLTLAAGLVGALIAWLVGWSIGPAPKDRTAWGVRPWHVGALIALADIVAVAAIAGVTA